VRRVDLDAFVALDPSIDVGTATHAFFAKDLAVAPDGSGVVALVRTTHLFPFAYSYVDDEVAVLAGAAVGSVTAEQVEVIGFGATPTRLYGITDGAVIRYAVNAPDVQVDGFQSSTRSLFLGRPAIDGARLYDVDGRVSNLESGAVLATLPGIDGHVAVAAAPTQGRVYYVTANGVRAYDATTFAPVGTTDVPGVAGDPTRAVAWGTSGVAFTTSTGQLFLVGDDLAGCAAPLDCDDRNACTTETCDGGVCGHTRLDCAADECLVNACDLALGCVTNAGPGGGACSDDGDPCTVDVCQDTGCAHRPIDPYEGIVYLTCGVEAVRGLLAGGTPLCESGCVARMTRALDATAGAIARAQGTTCGACRAAYDRVAKRAVVLLGRIGRLRTTTPVERWQPLYRAGLHLQDRIATASRECPEGKACSR
jgi:hypothetical protein